MQKNLDDWDSSDWENFISELGEDAEDFFIFEDEVPAPADDDGEGEY